MKALSYLLIACLLSAGSAFAESTSLLLDPANVDAASMQKLGADQFGAQLGFRMAGLELEPAVENGVTYQKVKPMAPDDILYGETGEEGLPDLPIYAHMVGIPDQSGVRLEITSITYETVDGYEVMPTQTPTLEGSDEVLPFVKNEEFYGRDEFYPPEVVRLGEPIIARDLRMIQVIISPVQYNPVTREMRVYTHIDYNLHFEGYDSRNVKIRRSNRIAESYLPYYRALVPNADELLAGYQPVRGGYLIITPDAFVDTVQQLARWKHLKGYQVVVATASQVDPNGNDPTSAEVKTYIQTAYDTWDYPPEYICIVGDRDGTYRITDFPWSGYASDHDYACVEGTDIHPDIMISRMSVRSASELHWAMAKAIRFDRDPYMGEPDYYLRGLSSAGNIGSVTPRLTVLWVRHKLMELGYNRVDTVFAWSTGDPGADSIRASMNRGVSMISYRGWGYSTAWGAPVFNSYEIDNLSHGWKIGICLAITCGIGNFGATECWGENWIRSGTFSLPQGGPAFFGSTDGGTHTKWNNPIMIGYYWGLFEEGIYHFGLAAARGKFQQFNSFPNQYSHVNKYHHTYNTLGEPELDVRTAIPRYLTVNYPSTIPVGTNVLDVHVSASDGRPLEGVYVNLLKGRAPGEEVFVGGPIDENGDVTLDFSTATPDTMFVTVTGRNCFPHEGFTLVQTQPVYVGVNNIAVDDDNSGNSSGNSDGNVNPSETAEFAVTLRNFGNSTTATNVQATLSSPDPRVNVTVPNQSYGSIAPGNNANSGKFAAHFDPDIPQGDHIILQLDISSDQGNWTAALPVDIKSMHVLYIDASYPGDSNGRLDPGESSSYVVSLQNIGELAGTAVVGVLSTSDTAITVTDGTANFGNMPIDDTVSNAASPFVIQASEGVYNGHNANFNLELTSSNGSVASRMVSLVVGNVSTYDPVGPDDYGYYMYDNTDTGYEPFPFYDWTEIGPPGGPGTRINFGNSDDYSSVISLPFDFVYYGQSFDYMLVCINGFVAFDTSVYDMGGNRWSNSHNMPIPEPSAPAGLIGVFWDDLEYSGSYNGVFKYYDSANHRFIIEWKNCTHATSGSPQTFQMIVYDPNYYPTPTGDSEILFQYQVVNNNDNDNWSYGEEPGLYSTVGFQNLENNGGLQYTFDNMYHSAAAPLESGRAIKITTGTGLLPPPDIEYDPAELYAFAGVGETTAETLSISNIGEGTLLFSLSEIAYDRRLRHDDPPDIAPLGEPIGYTERPANKSGDTVEPFYPPSITDFGGPDNFGNRWIDSDEPDGPVFGWVDISSVGTEVYPGEDGYEGPISMNINMPFYENTYSSLYINSNGFLTFTAGSGDYTDDPIPTPGAPDDMIAIYWDDLSPQYGHVYYYRDTANDRFIVSYVNVPNWSYGGSLNFQAILYLSGQIILQYNTLDPGSDDLFHNTIGIENSDGTDGLQIAHDNVYVHQFMAIRIYSPPVWLMSDIHSGALGPGEDTIAVITFDASELDEGEFNGAIQIFCNDPNESFVNIPVLFTVGGPQCEYVVGDFNGSGEFNIADIVAAFSKLKTGLPDPAYECECPPGSGNIWAVAMDLNNSCDFNIADVVTGFSNLKIGSPALVPCESCPPGGRLAPGDRPLIHPRLKSGATKRKGTL